MQSTSHTSRRTSQGSPFYRTLCVGSDGLIGSGVAKGASDIAAAEQHHAILVDRSDLPHWNR